MSTITLELPESLAQQLRDEQIDEQEIEAIAVAAIEIWLAESRANRQQTESGARQERFQESASSFAQRLVRENRELFETLAQR